MIRRPPRSTLSSSSAASDVYKRQQSPTITNNIGGAKPTAYHKGFYRTPPESPLDNAVRTFSNISCMSAQTVGGGGGGGAGGGAYLSGAQNASRNNNLNGSSSPLQSSLGGGIGGGGFISRTGSRNIVLSDSPPWGSATSHPTIANVRPINSYNRSSARTPTTPPMNDLYAMLDD
eukprot:TRINITY_DN15745_c0_g1_i3.p1 TRINITY_DN15745_c0_g1~~TRINITY_DN15745_c0_g1_i3.p1  ORF type:complete len:175 (-),score=39.08 TRINITY_DN15745_c0_g1_i3:699-1223(-)